MKAEVEIQRESAAPDIPADEAFKGWVEAVLANQQFPYALTIRVVDEVESRELNARYRDKDAPTNVLSFESMLPGEVARLLDEAGKPLPLGDLVICAPVVAREAAEQGKPLNWHWAHLTIHGVLHLLGHDHQGPAETRVMEQLERDLLAALGISDPYVAD